MNSNLYAETFQHILALIFVSNLWVIEAKYGSLFAWALFCWLSPIKSLTCPSSCSYIVISAQAKPVSSQTHLQAISAISMVQGTFWHHCDRKSISISSSTGKLPSFLNSCKQIAAKQNSGHWAFSQFVLLCSMSSPASLLWGILVMNPVFHIHRTWLSAVASTFGLLSVQVWVQTLCF